jgi:hypothetical protein
MVQIVIEILLLTSEYEVTVTSLKEELLRFEFVGPRTHIVLNGALTVAENEPKDDSKMDIEDKEPSLTEATAGSKVNNQ